MLRRVCETTAMSLNWFIEERFKTRVWKVAACRLYLATNESWQRIQNSDLSTLNVKDRKFIQSPS